MSRLANSSWLGPSAIVAATLTYGTFGLLSALIGQEYAAFYQNFLRQLVVGGVILLVIGKTGGWSLPSRLARRRLFLWALIASPASAMFFVALLNLPQGMAYFLLYVGMVFSALLSGRWILHERMTQGKWVALAMVFCGLFLIFGFSLPKDGLPYVLLAIATGGLIGVWNVYSKVVSTTPGVTEAQMLLSDVLVSLGVLVTISALLGEPWIVPTVSWSSLGIVLYALGYILATWLLIVGFKHMESQKASVLMPMEAFWGALLAWFVLQEAMGWQAWLGGIVIISGAMLQPLLDRQQVGMNTIEPTVLPKEPHAD